MNVSKAMVSVLLVLGALGVQAFERKVWIKGVTDKPAIDYRCGETMTFTLELAGPKEDVAAAGSLLDWERTGDDLTRETGRVDIAKGPFVYKTKTDKPGFVRLQAWLLDKDGKRGDWKRPFFDGGAGAEIEKLEAHPEPKDFDAFWKGQFARLDLVPMKADLVQVTNAWDRVRVFAVRIDCAGLRPVTGYLSYPREVEQGKTFPARLTLHGYSGDNCVHKTPNRGFSLDEIRLDINAHGLKPAEFGATDADTKALRWEIRSHDQTYAFDPKQNADPETAYFNGMVLRVKRALQYLKTVKGWNGKDLIASGGSQGGLQTIWAAACGEGVTLAESGITWNCDMYTNGTARMDPKSGICRGPWYIPWVDALGYYDAVNFARRIPKSCRTVITRAGLGDYTCPPTGLAKLWKAIPGNKEICWMQGSQHGYQPPEKYEGRDIVRTAK